MSYLPHNNLAHVVCGPPQNGKSTLAKAISAVRGHPWEDCSSLIYRGVAADMGVTVEELRSLPKEEIRPRLITKGDEMCDPDPGALCKRLYFACGARVIAGVRRASELRSFIGGVGSRNVVAVWIERPGEEKIKDNTEEELMRLCDVRVTNNGTLDQLDAVATVVAHIGQRMPVSIVASYPLDPDLGVDGTVGQ